METICYLGQATNVCDDFKRALETVTGKQVSVLKQSGHPTQYRVTASFNDEVIAKIRENGFEVIPQETVPSAPVTIKLYFIKNHDIVTEKGTSSGLILP